MILGWMEAKVRWYNLLTRTQSRIESWKEAEFSLSWKEESRLYYNI